MSWRNKKLRLPKGMREFPKEATDLPINKVIEMYNDNFTGIKYDPDAKEELMEMQPVPDGDIVAMQVGLADTGAGKLSIPFVYTFNQYPKVWPSFAQETGDCFYPGTMVHGEILKPIEQIEIGDKVWTGEGKLTKVISKRKVKTYKPTVKITPVGGLPLLCTNDHKVLVYRMGSIKKGRVSRTRYERTIAGTEKASNIDISTIIESYENRVPTWVKAGELTNRDCLLTPIKFDRLKKPTDCPGNLTDTDEGLFFLGCFSGNGYAGGSTVELVSPVDDLVTRLVHIAKEHGFNPKVSDSKGCQRIRIHSVTLVTWLRDNLYNPDKSKAFPGWLIGCNSFLEGLIATDGYYSPNRGTYTLDSTSKGLIYGCYATLVIQGHEPSICICSRSKGTYANAKPLYRMIWTPDKKNNQVWRDEKFVCRPIRKIELIEKSSIVYDIGVADKHHSFLAEGHAVSNCTSRAGKNTGLVLLGVEAALGEPDEETGEIEGFPEYPLDQQSDGIICYENIYGDRGHRGQGASCSRLIIHVTRDGGLLLRKNYPEIDLDLTKPNTKLAISWGARGTPTNVKELAHANLIRNAVDVPTHEVARDYIHNGYPIWVCSSLGWSDQCDANGYAKRQGSWGHSWIVAGYDDRPETIKAYGFPLFLYIHDWGCHSDDTEVLTKRGWLLFQDLEMDDEIATLNQETHHLEYQNPTKLFEYDFNGYLWNYTSKGCGVDLLVTSNHNMYYCKVNKDKSDPSNWEISQAENMICHTHFKKDALWVGEEIPVKELGEYRIPMNDWLEFLGIFIGDGSTTLGHIVRKRALPNGKTRIDRYKQYIVSISRKTLEKDKQIQEIIDRMPFKMGIGKNAWSKNSKLLFNELRSLGKAANKHIPDYVMDLPPEQLQHLYKGMMLTDGLLVQTETGPRETYFTGSAILADQFQEMLLKMGGSGSVSITDRRGKDNGTGGISRLLEFRVGIRWKSLNPKPSKGWKPILVPYKGKVYCAEVPNHLMYVRRNGKPVWSGNSWNNNKKGILIRDTNILIPPGSFWADARLLDQCDMTALSGLKGWKRQVLPDLGGTTWG